MEIINSKGERYLGIIGAVPVHFLKNREDSKPEIDAMFVDIGADSKEEVEDEFGIQLGDEIVPIPHFHYDEKKRKMMSKAFDDRAGVAAVIEIGKIAAEMVHPNTVYCVGSVQEEVGTRGAMTLANYTDADVCFVLESAPADDISGIPFTSQTGVGKGAHVRVFDPTMIVNPQLKNFVAELAPDLFTEFAGKFEFFLHPLKSIWFKTEYINFNNKPAQNIISLGSTLIF